MVSDQHVRHSTFGSSSMEITPAIFPVSSRIQNSASLERSNSTSFLKDTPLSTHNRASPAMNGTASELYLLLLFLHARNSFYILSPENTFFFRPDLASIRITANVMISELRKELHTPLIPNNPEIAFFPGPSNLQSAPCPFLILVFIPFIIYSNSKKLLFLLLIITSFATPRRKHYPF